MEVLWLSAIPVRMVSPLALVLSATATAVSMPLASTALAWALGRAPVVRQVRRILPAFGLASLAFGLWYGAVALEAVLGR